MSRVGNTARSQPDLHHQPFLKYVSLWTKAAICLWFGAVTGLVEGAGLLVFQRVNWRNWGTSVHVSREILWISPFVDCVLALFLLLLMLIVWRLRGRHLPLSTLSSALVFFAVFDWLDLTARLYYWSCLLLAIGAAVLARRWLETHTVIALRFWRTSLKWLLAGCVLMFVGLRTADWWIESRGLANLPSAQPDSPNILVVVIDTLRADHLSSYGYSRPTTPNIDRIAGEGVLFENAIAPCSWSLPSHASLLTGRYQFDHGFDNVQPMPWTGWGDSAMHGYPTLGDALQKLGYRTGAFSANRVYFSSNVGLGRGFIHFEDYFDSAADSFLRTLYGREVSRTLLASSPYNPLKWVLTRLGFAELFDRDTEGQGRHSRGRAIRKRAGEVNAEALDWIDRDRRRPFFAFLNYMDVHAPYGPPPGYPTPPWNHGTDVDQYDTGLRYADENLGSLVRALDERELSGNTILIVTSDHGESLGQHGMSAHASALYWELVHVPLIVRYPGHVPQGVRASQPVSNAAIPATLMELLGERDQREFPIVSLASLWTSTGNKSDWPFPLSEIAQNDIISPQDKAAGVPTAADGSMKSLVSAQWQIILHKKYGVQLYDRSSDRDESRNLAHTSEGKAEYATLQTALQNILAGSADRQAVTAPLAVGIPTTRQKSFGKGPQPVDDFYRFSANPGSKLRILTNSTASDRFDPVLSVQDQNGNIMLTCRNPEDDHYSSPGLPDPTPEMYDDVCVNDDLKSNDRSSSGLALSVPANSAGPVQLYLHVSDWNGRALPETDYAIGVIREK